MTKSGSAKICLGALLTAAVFMLQASCVFVPVLGTCFGAASTLVIAAAGALLKRRAVIVYLGAGLLMLAVSPRYAAEYLMTTGLAGLTLGMLTDKKPALPVLVSGLIMFSGLCCLTFLLGTAAFGGVFAGLPAGASLPVFAAFSAAYPAIWLYILRRFMKKAVFRFCYRN